MTIASVRIYYWPIDEELKKHLAATHWGFAEWFVRRLKPIREQLRGPEAKGVNIVNFMLYGDPERGWRPNTWAQRLNSFEYSTTFDFAEIKDRAPIDNIETLMKWASGIALQAPWPQVVAVGKALADPLSDEDRATLLPYLRWPRPIQIGPKSGKLKRLLAEVELDKAALKDLLGRK